MSTSRKCNGGTRRRNDRCVDSVNNRVIGVDWRHEGRRAARMPHLNGFRPTRIVRDLLKCGRAFRILMTGIPASPLLADRRGTARLTCWLLEQANRRVERCRTQVHVALRHAELAMPGQALLAAIHVTVTGFLRGRGQARRPVTGGRRQGLSAGQRARLPSDS